MHVPSHSSAGSGHIVFCHPPYFALYRYSSDVLRFELALGDSMPAQWRRVKCERGGSPATLRTSTVTLRTWRRCSRRRAVSSPATVCSSS